ncbi:MAG: T9SS type A sorting domain-containing protein [Bacteroidia bacterium]|nr:T9SS type A sorting domain-containing protein [Bacteroidia bacterium]
MVNNKRFFLWCCLLWLSLSGLLAQQSVLMVSGQDPSSINPGDQAILTALQNSGYTVTVKGGPNTPTSAADANGVDLVFISATADPTGIGNTFANVATPVIVSQSYIYDDMGMTDHTAQHDYGIAQNARWAQITAPNHPIAQSLTGIEALTTARADLRWGDPSNDADKIARLGVYGSRYAVFSYDTGDNMVGMQAPAPRIGLHMDTWTSTHSTNAGWTLFNQAVSYATANSTTSCTADAGSLTIDQSPLSLVNGSATVSATPDGNIHIPHGYSVIYVLSRGQNLVLEQANSTPDFTVTGTGLYTIHTLVYDADPHSPDFADLSLIQFGTTTGADALNYINTAGICASLDVAGAPVHVNGCTADAGTLTIDNDPVDLVNGSAHISATPDGNIHVPHGYSVIYVLTSGTNLVIEQVNTHPSFTVANPGLYTIHTLVYDADAHSPDFLDLSVVVPGTTTGGDVLGIINSNGICASLVVAGAPVNVNASCTADAGTLTIDQDPVVLANGSATVSATPDGNINIPAGYSSLFVLTSGSNLIIEQVGANPSFTVNAAGLYTIHTLVYDGDPNSPNFLDLSVVVPGTTTGGDVLGIVTTNGLCASLDVAGAPVHVNDCEADAGTLTIDQDPVVLANGSAMVSATPDGNINIPSGYSSLFVLTSGSNLVIEQVSANPSFTVNAAGLYTIHTLVYDGDPNSPNFLDLSVVVPGTTTGGDVLGIVSANGLCASLDVAGAPVHVNDCEADAGTLTIDQDPVVLANGSATVSATPDGNINIPAGYSSLFVLTSGSNLIIEQVGANPSFTVNVAGLYTIHTLVYDGDPNSPNFLDLSVVVPGTTTGGDVLGIVTTNGLCASLDVAGAPVHVNDCEADAGTLTIDQDPVVLANGSATVSATPDGNINIPSGYSSIFVLTSGSNLVIEQVSANPSFTVNAAGLYTIHTLVYDGDPNSPNFLDLSVVVPGTTTGGDVLGIVSANGLCASLDVAGAPVHVNDCEADAGTLTIDQDPVVLANGSATVSATPDGNINIPSGYSSLFVLTSGSNLIIEQVGANPSFTVNTAGLYTIHTLVYDGDPNSPNFLDLSVVVPGTTTGGDVLGIVTANGLCASLDVAGAPVHVNDCEADAGTLTIDQDPVVLANGSATVSATPNGNINIPSGYSSIFVLTSGSNLIIEQVGANPSFTVNAAGLYTIHTLVYDGDPNSSNFLDLSVVVPGTTTGGDVLGIVTANGLCASLDVAGAPVHVNDCEADAGTLTIDQDPVVLANGSATVSATPNGNINIPSGYSSIFVLTSGSNLVIEQVSANPSFTVTSSGLYTIHTLVYDGDPNSPNFLDLSVVVPGTTTGGDVLGIVSANGLCASLDVAGAPVHVNDCEADAGTLTIDQDPVVLANGSATVSATPNGNINIPSGYSSIFVLTSGSNLVIEQVSANPSFTVTSSGLYTIHTLVYDGDPNSPNFLDLSVVVPGTTTGGDVLGIVSANGLCASLDVAGAPVHVNDCEADAGTLTIDQDPVVLANGSATVSATPNGNINIPSGYSSLFVLTSGSNLIIEQVGANPSFTVNTAGLYTIHTLVYDGDSNSPNFLDLSVVVPGTTTGGDVLGIVTANGLCASLDVAGAPVHVNDCSADAGTLTIDHDPVSLDNGSTTVSATPDGNINVPAGYSVLYVLTSGQNLVIEQVNTSPDFVVNAAGLYTIHTLVYDGDPSSPNFLDLSVVVPGTTTGGDVRGIVAANGLCASLDVAGAPVHVNEACTADAGAIRPDQLLVFIPRNDTVNISATPLGNANVPAGYSTLYVLTRGLGLTTEAVSATPDFDISRPGLYRIHTLIYDADPNSANFLDLSVVQFGTTTGVDVVNLITANGICASLDVRGAITFALRSFSFGHFNALNSFEEVELSWSAENAVAGATYILERSQDGVVFQQVAKIVEEKEEGESSHKVMDSNPMEGFTTYRLRVIDSRGQTIETEEEVLFVELTSSISISAYPNPVLSRLNVRRNDNQELDLYAKLIDLTGREVQKTEQVLRPGGSLEINMDRVPEGFYQLILTDFTGKVINIQKIHKR